MLCVLSGWCVYGGDRGFVKTFTAWQKLASMENTGGGTGGYSLPRITAGDLMAILDNSYRKCYNKCNDDNKKAISHQTGKNASVSRFAPCPYKIPLSRRKRRVANLHKNWKYKTAWFVRRRWTHEKTLYLYKAIGHFVKNVSCGYKMVTVIR